MKHKKIEIFLFIDALGWKIVNDHRFLEDLLPCRRKSFMQFGYSSSAIPTILSGKTPAEHGHLGLFRFTLTESPFKLISRLAWLFKPESFWNRGRVRHHLSKLLKKLYGFTGYFQLYRMPLWKLKFVDYCEKKDLFVSGGMKPFENLFDALESLKIPFHISDWHLKDEENFLAAEKAVAEGKKFLFVYTATLDGLLHGHVGEFETVQNKLDQLESQIKSLYSQAENYADEVHFTVLSDHGMTPLAGTADIMGAMEKSTLVFGKDYGACYDSTMARFYYFSPESKNIIEETMRSFPGKFLSVEDEKKYGIYRQDRLFGDGIFLLDPGVQLAPSDMGEKPLTGMHGFAPEHIHSAAAILSNTALPDDVKGVCDYFNLMMQRAKEL